MTNIKISDLLKKYKENKEFLKANKDDTMEDVQKLAYAERRNEAYYHNLVAGLSHKLGFDKAIEVIEKTFDIEKKKNPNFDAEAHKKEFRSIAKMSRGASLFTRVNEDDPDIYQAEGVKAYYKEHNLTGLTRVQEYGYEKIEQDLVSRFGPNMKKYIDDNTKLHAGLDEGIFTSNLEEALKELNIDLDTEVEYTPSPVDLPDNEIPRKFMDDAIKAVEGTRYYQRDENLKQELEEIKQITGRDWKGANEAFTSLESYMESKTNERAHRLGEDKAIEERAKVIDNVHFNFNLGANREIVKEGKEEELQKLKDSKFKISDKRKEGMLKILKKMENMNYTPSYADQGDKIYAFEHLDKQRVNLALKLQEIEEIEKQLKERNDALAKEADPKKKFRIQESIQSIEDKKNTATRELFRIKKAYDEADKDMMEFYNMAKEYFPDLNHLNTNVAVTRNGFMPAKYRKDPMTCSVINGMFYIHNMIKRYGISPEEFVADPAAAFKNVINRTVDENNINLTGEEKTVEEATRKIASIAVGSKEAEKRIGLSSFLARSMEIVSAIDPEHTEENIAAYHNIKEYGQNLADHRLYYDVVGKKAEKTYENIILAGNKVPIKDLLEDDRYDPVNYKMIPGKSFNTNSFINDNKNLTPDDIVLNYKALVDTIINTNQSTSERNDGIVNDKVSEQLTAATKAFGSALLKYCQAYQIDTDKPEDPTLITALSSIKNPSRYIKTVIHFDGYNDEPDFRELQKNLRILGSKSQDLDDAKDTIEEREKNILKKEKDFDKRMSKYKQDMDKKIDKLMKKPKPEDYDKVEELQKAYQKELLDHTKSLKRDVLEGRVPLSFYLARTEQVMANAPLGDLKLYGNPLNIKEEEYIELKEQDRLNEFLRKNPDKKKEDLPALDNEAKEDLKREYQQILKNNKNEKENAIKLVARRVNRPYPAIDIKEQNYAFGLGENVNRMAKENATRADIVNVIEENPQRQRISIDLNENKDIKKSDAIKQGDDLVKNIQKNHEI